MAESGEEEDIKAKARQFGLEYVPPRLIDTRSDLAGLMPEAVARECNVLPQPGRGTTLRVLMSDLLDFDTIDRVRFCCGGPVEVALLPAGRSVKRLTKSTAAPRNKRTLMVRIAGLLLSLTVLMRINNER